MSSFLSHTELAKITGEILCPPFEWCTIRGGPVVLENALHYGGTPGGSFEVADFWMSCFPITNAQYERFLDHPDGYDNPGWWSYSAEARQWRSDHTRSQPPAFEGANLPRTRVSWFDSMAFCTWLAAQLQDAQGVKISLPTELEWQRAALGDSGWEYPWGNELDGTRANYGDMIGVPTAVDRYPLGQSPYGMMDMIGNVWEWCSTAWGSNDGEGLGGYSNRVIRGGAWNVSNSEYLRASSRGGHPPRGRLNDCGFRIACHMLQNA
jgi:formylglycine-generating enzyme required for sulfatase activity